jgi:hypothetical protein
MPFKKIIKSETGADFPTDPYQQLEEAIKAVFRSWNGDRAIAYRRREKIPDNLGTAVKPGSFFHNGEVTLELKGVSLVDGAACAMVGYDSGESTLEMVMATSSGQEIMMKGENANLGILAPIVTAPRFRLDTGSAGTI